MGRSSQKKETKKSGPKGKKARAKAKLERQWGEVDQQSPAEGGSKGASIRRGDRVDTKTKHRRVQADKDGESVNATTSNQRGTKTTKTRERRERQPYSGSDSSDDDIPGETACQTFLAKIRRDHKHRRVIGSSNGQQEKKQEPEWSLQSHVDDLDNDSDEFETSIKTNIETSVSSKTTKLIPEVQTRDEREDVEDETVEEASQSVRNMEYYFSNRFAIPSSDDTSSPSAKTLSPATLEMVPLPAQLENMELQISTGWPETFWGTVSTSPSPKNESPSPRLTDWTKWGDVLRSSMRPLLKQKSDTIPKNSSWPLSAVLDPLVFSYHDTLLAYPHRDPYQRQSIERTLALHALQHVLQSRATIYQHNQRIQALEDQEDEQQKVSDNDNDEEEESWRDQGFTRPTVLILLPTRSTCHDFVKTLLSLLQQDQPQQPNSRDDDARDRFDQEYGPLQVDDADMDENARVYRQKAIQSKGSDWHELFGETANDDDDFKLGLSLHPKRRNKKSVTESTCDIKLYSDFYKSDIIVASPLGLKISVTPESISETSDNDADFLSSIEMCIVHRSDVLLMQNWDHVMDLLPLLNQQPKKTNDTDFSRVRPYLLAGQAAQWRQLIMTSQFLDPLILSTFKRFSENRQGQVRIRRKTPAEEANVTSVLLPVRQVFQRVSCSTIANQGADRVRYFVDSVLPQIQRHKQHHTMIFIPSYFDFVSLRNILLKKEVEFVSVTEYARTSEVSRGRARFLQGRKPIMLYTGRAHYFLRHQIKGIRHLIFLGVPEEASFYADHVNLLNEGLEKRDDIIMDDGLASCLVLYTKYDSYALERIVGTANCSRMVRGEKSSFIFAS
jgi:U3 small nucleolar RNA-associated protein 25